MTDQGYPARSEHPRNEALRDALAASLDAPLEGRQPIYRALLSGIVLVPTVRSSHDQEAMIAVFPIAESGQVLVSFSDVTALRMWSEEATTFVVMPGHELAQLARRHQVDGVLLNPASQAPGSLAPAELDMLADGFMPAEAGSAVTSAASARPRHVGLTHFTYPEAALSYIQRLTQRPEVEAVDVLDVGYGDGEPVSTLAVRFVPGTTDTAVRLREIAGSVAEALPRGQRVDVTEADDALHAEALRLGVSLTSSNTRDDEVGPG